MVVATALVARLPPNDWAEAVFHVLAHVRASAHLAPSVFDAAYVADAAAALGPAESRSLAEDADALGRLLGTFEALARVELLAWLFRSRARAAVSVGRDLADLGPADVDAPALLAEVQRAGAPAEILRAAAELEGPLVARVPSPPIDERALDAALAAAVDVAPHLAACAVGVIPALRIRGRALGDAIWVGAATVDHMAWQAAHEATVSEVARELAAAGDPAASSSAPIEIAHDRVEREAVRRLATRARSLGRGAAHAAWLACFACDYDTGEAGDTGDNDGDGGARSGT